MAKSAGGSGDQERIRDAFLDVVGRKVKLARTAAGFTQKQLAEAIGAGSAWVYLLEDGQQNAQLHSIRKVAEALGVPLNSLLPDLPEAQVSTEGSAVLHRTLSDLVVEVAALRKSVDLLRQERGTKTRKPRAGAETTSDI